MAQKQRKRKRGAALIFTLFFLILLAGISLSLYNVSTSSHNLTTSYMDIRKGEFAAESGIRYYTAQILSMEMQGKTPDQILAWLDSMVNVRIQCGTNTFSSWFELIPYDANNNVLLVDEDYLIRVRGGSSEYEVTSNSLLSYLLNTAYAQNENTVEFMAVLGPKTEEGGGGTGGFFRTMPKVEDSTIAAYNGSSATVRVPPTTDKKDWKRFLNSLAPNVQALPYEKDLSFEIQSYMDDQLDQIKDLYNDEWKTLGNWQEVVGESLDFLSEFNKHKRWRFLRPFYLSQKKDFNYHGKDGYYNIIANNILFRESNGTIGAGKFDLARLKIAKNSRISIGDPTGQKFTYMRGESLVVRDNSTLVLGPGVYTFRRIYLAKNAKLILDTTNGPVYLNVAKTTPEHLKERAIWFVQELHRLATNVDVKKIWDKVKDNLDKDDKDIDDLYRKGEKYYRIKRLIHYFYRGWKSKFKVTKDSQIIVFKNEDKNNSLSSYSLRTDQENKTDGLGPDGQKIAKIFVAPLADQSMSDFDITRIKIEVGNAVNNAVDAIRNLGRGLGRLNIPRRLRNAINHATRRAIHYTVFHYLRKRWQDKKGKIAIKDGSKVGVFASGPQSELWDPKTTASAVSSILESGANTEYNKSVDKPTAGALEIHLNAAKKGVVKVEDSTLNAALYVSGTTEKVKVEMEDSTFNGLLALAGTNEDNQIKDLREKWKKLRKEARKIRREIHKLRHKVFYKLIKHKLGKDFLEKVKKYMQLRRELRHIRYLLKKYKKPKVKIEFEDTKFNIDPNLTLFPTPETVPNSTHVKLIARVN
ncbi:MAG: hypothetical protein D6805_00375 [Planctomycetota bacterium]|nr:MAG: hypothetical protein D6805_00375 [Planctomycetota bacterium]